MLLKPFKKLLARVISGIKTGGVAVAVAVAVADKTLLLVYYLFSLES